MAAVSDNTHRPDLLTCAKVNALLEPHLDFALKAVGEEAGSLTEAFRSPLIQDDPWRVDVYCSSRNRTWEMCL